MNNLLKLKTILRIVGTQSLRLCAITLVAVIGFSFAACDIEGAMSKDDDDSGGKTVTGIYVSTANSDYKRDYRVGETFETAGIKLNVYYSDGSSEEIAFNATFTATGYDMSKIGDQTVTITHTASGKTTTSPRFIRVFPAVATKADFIDTWKYYLNETTLEISETEVKYTSYDGKEDTFTITSWGNVEPENSYDNAYFKGDYIILTGSSITRNDYFGEGTNIPLYLRLDRFQTRDELRRGIGTDHQIYEEIFERQE